MGGIILFIDKVPILWKTFITKCVSLSTMEAEYVTLAEASKEVMWLKNIIEECKELEIEGMDLKEINIFFDNQAAIDFSKSSIENSRTRHVDVKYHFLRNLVYDEISVLQHINSKYNLADVFTKHLVKKELDGFCEEIFVKNE